MERKTIAVIGTGRLGSALVHALTQAKYEVREIVHGKSAQSRAASKRLARDTGARASNLGNVRLDADVIWFCVPDSRIADIAEELAGRGWRGKVAFHSSGALASDALGALRRKGASIASVHPLMTFVRGSEPALEAVPFALEGDAAAVRAARMVVRDLGGVPFAIAKRQKTAYHAFATMICPLLVSLLATSEQIARLAGIPAREARRRMVPIVRQTLANYERLGPAASFSGPIVRGDVETIARHLKLLAKNPPARQAYVALASASLEYLPSEDAKPVRRILRGV